MKRELLPLLLLVSVAIVSGCIRQGPTVGVGNGIIIKSFSFDYSPIYAEESIGLTLEVQNVGGEEGTLTKITVFGVDAPAATAGNLTWGYGTNPFDLTPNVVLAPPDPTTGFEGEEYFEDWVPEAPKGVRASTDYDFEVRVEYDYSTTFTGRIRVVDNDYLRTLPSDEREKLVKQGGVVDSSVTAGPFSLAAATGRHFIVRSGDPAQIRTIKFKITNIGGGYPYIKPFSTTNLHKIKVITDEGIDCSVPQEIKLSRGKTGVISCEFTSPAHGTFTNKVDKMFSVTLDYSYYLDSATSITVNPILD